MNTSSIFRNAMPVIENAAASNHKRQLARRFRHNPTASEDSAWQLLRNRQCFGLKFRRQQVIRGYIVDFYCASLRLAIEIDGPIHCGRASEDFVRTMRLMHEAHIRLVRIDAALVNDTSLKQLLIPFISPIVLPLSETERGPGGEVF